MVSNDQQQVDYPPPIDLLRDSVLRINHMDVVIDYTLGEREDAHTVAEWLEIEEEYIPEIITHFSTYDALHQMALAIKAGFGFSPEFIFGEIKIEKLSF